jgi:lysine-N-methylase
MLGFDCLGGSCEDTCCRDWTLEVDRDGMERIRGRLGPDEAAALRVLEAEQARDLGKDDIHGYIDRRADGTCPFLDRERLCSLVIRFGPKVLSRACAVFPRAFASFPDRVEIHGSLACPEVARRCLLDPAALDLVPAPGAPSAPAHAGRRFESGGAWAHYLFDVRRSVVDLLRRRDFPLAARLALAAELAAQIEPVYHRGTTAFDGAGRQAAEKQLAAALATSGDAAYLAPLCADFCALQVPGEQTIAVVANVLIARRQLPHTAAYARLLADVFASYQEEALGRPASSADSVPAAALWAVYRGRRGRLQDRFGDTPERIFANYGAHFFMRWPYLDSPTVMHHLCKLGIRLAVIRFLFAGHPATLAALEEPHPGPAMALLEGAAVAVVQTFAKAVQHHPNFERILDGSLDQEGGASFGRAVCLAKLC